jgi:hypothetical protein
MPDPELTLPEGVTLAKFRQRVGMLTQDAEVLGEYLEGAASMAGVLTRRVLIAEQGDDDEPVTKTFRVEGHEFLRVPDVRVLDELRLDGVVATADDYELILKPQFVPGPAPQIRLRRRVAVAEIDGKFGWAALPALLSDAIYAHAGRNYNERNALFADSMDHGDGGALYSYFRMLPLRVKGAYNEFRITSDWYGL